MAAQVLVSNGTVETPPARPGERTAGTSRCGASQGTSSQGENGQTSRLQLSGRDDGWAFWKAGGAMHAGGHGARQALKLASTRKAL
jgi:hypothetical protein